ncbi:MAG: hypothetical protein APF84_19200 [Gracilibacter sp. BRH_c7a]|nr:MAG: hypothetical protein APF84_19200 [Gracilibacter sp. BRH_c7a]
MKGYISSIESFSALDGPGIRSVVFLQGCPLRCFYCHNPETWKTNDGMHLESSEVINRVNRNLKFIQKRGGVTISGGEPTMQIDFLSELLEGFKSSGLHTAVDTSGYVSIEDAEKIVEFTDLFIVDIKHMDNHICQQVTGKSNENMIALLKYLEDKQKKVWLRSVLLPGLTDSEEYISRISSYVRSLSNVERLELLPCHDLAANKYRQMGLNNRFSAYANYDIKTLQKIKTRYIELLGEKVVI